MYILEGRLSPSRALASVSAMVTCAMKQLHCAALLLAGALTASHSLAEESPTLPAPDTPETLATGVRNVADADADSLQQRRQLQAAITELESEYGAYSPVLPERLLSLGMALQAEGRHVDAAAVFKRGTHLARVSSGLYSTEQLPLLESEISSLQAIGDHLAVDERQRYLYRVQSKAPLTPEQRAKGLLQQADWQRQAFFLTIDEDPGLRLLQMWEYYRLALNEVLGHQGDTSRDLLPPLYGMLQAQYMISAYRWAENTEDVSRSFSGNGLRPPTSAYQRDNFDRGRAVLNAIYNLETRNSDVDSGAATRALTMMGDWLLWHGDREDAIAQYTQALAELADDTAAQALAAELFAAPVPLPAMEGLELHAPLAAEGVGDILLSLTVDARGKVANVERVDDSGEASGAANQLMRKLRRTPFRPRFDLASGTPVATDNWVMAYDSTR